MSVPDWVDAPLPAADEAFAERARRRQRELTKPPGALGRLETLAETLCALQRRDRPRLDAVQITVFAADHGVVAEGVSAFPQAVTAEMVRNFARGGAAVSVLARTWGARLNVVNLGTVEPLEPLPGVVDARIAAGTANLAAAPAMTDAQCAAAMTAGREAVRSGDTLDLFIGGEMGIGNTTAATAVACALLDLPARALTGPGTGLDAAGVSHKASVIERALARHGGDLSPWAVLCNLGGLELAGLAGAYLTCAEYGIPCLIDGFIATSAALAAVRLNPGLRPWLLFAHGSAEPGHHRLLTALEATPLIDLGLRLGEGSGAAIALPLLKAALALHNGMATFTEAGVSGG